MSDPFQPPETIGFIGLGMMGQPMTRNLAKAGFRLALHDVNRAVAERLAAELNAAGTGCATVAASLVELGHQCRVVITMVPDGKVVREIALGESGGSAASLSAGMAKDSILIDMSSSAPMGTRALGEALAAKGIGFMDAPVSGGVRRAVSGTLAIMCGGDPALAERVKPILAGMGSQIFHAGPLGAGHAIKALNNYVSGAAYAASCEAVLAAQQFGMDPQVAIDIINASSGMNNGTQNKLAQFVLSRSFSAGFSMGLMAKDLRTALDVLAATHTPAPLASHCVPLWEAAAKSLGAAADHTEFMRTLEKEAGAEVKARGK